MYIPSFSEFVKQSQKGNVISITREHLADMETPVSVASRFVDADNVFLLESVEGGERWGRYSFIGINPSAIFTIENETPYLYKDGTKQKIEHTGSPFFALREILKDYKHIKPDAHEGFCGGAVGFISFETSNEFEQLPKPKSNIPLKTCFMISDELIVFDNIKHTIKVIVNTKIDEFNSLEKAYEYACERIERIEYQIKNNPLPTFNSEPLDIEFKSNMTKEYFLDMVKKAKEYIINGDIIQVVLSQKFTTELPAHPMQIYRALRLINPSPYTFFFKYGDKILVGSSPEIMVRLQNGKAIVRPIAGTRPRNENEEIDKQNAIDLLNDEKERAEHVMLVDLGRNDLGRIAKKATVQVKDLMVIERYSHVMHIVSNVECEINDDMDAFDLVKASFPAGTLSGAPKIRAMEIINELEPEYRGAYGGAIGYIGYNGEMDLAITIRTLEIENNKISVQAGAGIVADSDPEKEFEETMHKSAGMKKALQLAANNLTL
jgi:anthranilate synthase component 1